MSAFDITFLTPKVYGLAKPGQKLQRIPSRHVEKYGVEVLYQVLYDRVTWHEIELDCLRCEQTWCRNQK